MRILHVGPLPPPVGGMATVVQNLRSEQTRFARVRVLNNVKTTPPDRSLARALAAHMKLLWKLTAWCVTWQPHVVHIHTCSWFSFWRQSVDVILSRMVGRRVVLHIHGAEFHLFLASLSGVKAFLARRVFSLCHRVIVLGRSWIDVLAPWCALHRLSVVYNGVPVPDTPGGIFEEHEKWIVCLANYQPRKGQEELLRAVSMIPDETVKVALFGNETDEKYKNRLLELSRNLGIEQRVLMPGPVSGEHKDLWLEKARIFCMPSRNEGLPMAMLEAMAVSTPVVVTRVGSIGEVIRHGRNGLLYESGDVSALTRCLNLLLDHPEERDRIGANGRRTVLKNFSVTAQVERLHEIYGDVIRGKTTRRDEIQPLDAAFEDGNTELTGSPLPPPSFPPASESIQQTEKDRFTHSQYEKESHGVAS